MACQQFITEDGDVVPLDDGEVGIVEGHLIEQDAREDRVVETCVLVNRGAAQIGPIQLRLDEVGPLQMRPDEGSPLQMRSKEVGPLQLCLVRDGPLQLCPGEVCSLPGVRSAAL